MGKSKGFILATMPIGKKAPDVTVYPAGAIDAFRDAREKAITDETIRTVYQRWQNGRWSKYSPDFRIMVKLYPYQVPAGVIRKLAEMGVQA